MLRVFVILLALAGCAPSPGAPWLGPLGRHVIAVEGSNSGIQRFATQEHEIYRDRTGIMTARPVILQRGDHRTYAILTNVRRRAPNGPIIEVMATDDGLLDYDLHDRLYTHCVDGCQRAEVGAIHLTDQQFRDAAQNGFYILADGRRQSYVGTVPSGAFRRVLQRADAQRHVGAKSLPRTPDRVFSGRRAEQ